MENLIQTEEMKNYKQKVHPKFEQFKLKISDLTVEEEKHNYLNQSKIFNSSLEMIELVKEFNPQDESKMEVQVLSHMFDPKRSKFLVHLKQQASIMPLESVYRIFTYDGQQNLYKDFEKIPNVFVEYIPTTGDFKKYGTLGGKREYMFEYNVKNSNKRTFYIEDDCINFHLPIGAVSGSNTFCNKRFFFSYNFIFKFWEFVCEKYNLTFSGMPNNMEFTFRKDLFLERQICQVAMIDHEFAVQRDIKYDQHSGWDDYDFAIQQAIYGNGLQNFMIGYSTPALKSGVSAMSSDSSALAERCERNTKALLDKWGSALVKVDDRKGLFNAKLNLQTVKKAKEAKIGRLDLVGMTLDEFKIKLKEARELLKEPKPTLTKTDLNW